MRIEQISTTKNIPQNVREPALAQGDILVAEVTAVNGDTVSLKTNEGLSLTAKLISDMQVDIGDLVETVVDETGHGRYVLRVLNIARNSSEEMAQSLINDQLARGDINIRTLMNALLLLKMNPGADPQGAAFLSSHGISGSPQTIKTLAQLTKANETAGRQLAEVSAQIEAMTASESNNVKNAHADGAAEAKAKTMDTAANRTVFEESTVSQREAVGTVESETAAHKGPAVAADTIAAKADNSEIKAAKGQTPHDSLSLTPGDDSKGLGDPQGSHMPQTAQEPLKAGYISAESAATQADYDTTGIDENPQPIIQGIKDTKPDEIPGRLNTDDGISVQTEKGTAPQNAKADTLAALLAAKLSALFVRLDDLPHLAANIKKTADALPAQLKELKLLLSRHDTISKDVSERKLESVEKQLELMSQIKRFDCYHIPLIRSDDTQTTAELYIYRQRKSRKAAEEENIVILLGLDTQYAGRVESIVRAGSSGLSIALYLEDMRLADELQADMLRLKEAVHTTGFDHVDILIRQLVSRTTLLNAEERLNERAADGSGNVDIRI